MCGICGIINLDSEMTVSKAVIDRMVNQLLHRGPDAADVWLDRRVGLGHTRLSIIDLSKAANQPMSNEDGSIWITYNGEVYNFHALRKKLELKGHRFKSRSDTEVILHLYEEDGAECISQLRGMFAFGLWDQDKKQLLLVRDRMGQKPLYYYKDRQKLLFASEIKGILATGLVEGLPDYKALYQYLCLGYVPHPRTGFKGIRKLPPGHRLIVNGANVTVEPYWSLNTDSNKSNTLDEREASRRLADLLLEATRIRMISDVPLGVLLSGGLDSNSVAAMMSRCAGQIKTFTVGFEDALYDERNEARFLADKLGTDHHEMVVRPDITDLLPKLVCAYDEPFADPSAVPSYYVAQMASQCVTVVLNGDGGDENFAGYGEYIQGLVGRWTKNIPKGVASYFSRILDQKRPGKIKSLSQVLALSGRSQARIFGNLRLAVPMILMDSLLNPDYRALVGRFDPTSHLVECYQRYDRGDTANTMLAVDQRTFLPDDLLFKIDIATMNHSLEARSPFLDHHMVGFAAGLPGNLKVRGWRKKYILKEAMKDILPDQVLKRRKRGFDIPVGHWLREELKEICEDAFTSKGLVTELLQKNKLEEMFEDHVAERKEWGHFFWMVLMLHLWSETFLKGSTIAQR
jgi:asparagine synthase (glutamine-hydrolysing)